MHHMIFMLWIMTGLHGLSGSYQTYIPIEKMSESGQALESGPA